MAVPTISSLTLVGVPQIEANELSDPTQASGIELAFYGHRDDAIDLLAEHHLLLMPSIWDPFPNLDLEAYGIGLPVVASDTGGLAELLGNEKLLFSSGDVDDFLRTLKNVGSEAGFQEAKHWTRKRGDFLFDWKEVYFRTLCSGLSRS